MSTTIFKLERANLFYGSYEYPLTNPYGEIPSTITLADIDEKALENFRRIASQASGGFKVGECSAEHNETQDVGLGNGKIIHIKENVLISGDGYSYLYRAIEDV
jgi:hypothetical protein